MIDESFSSFEENFRKRRAFSVSQITGYIKDLFSEDVILSDVSVAGEISNFKFHSSGHLYFTLKDKSAALSAVMFRVDMRELGFEPENGQTVVCGGRVSLYEKTGQYQLYVDVMEPLGKGTLQAEFERLKAKLSAEGLFDVSRKKELPEYAERIAVVTSLTGAAVRDIINIIKRRAPKTEIFIVPALVQGENAAESVKEAIELVNEWGRADVLIVGRGGGSSEDLAAFNDESVVRAIASSKTPTISAVGHETDVTLADFAADLRAPTPSAAAEIAVADVVEAENRFRSLEYMVNRRITAALSEAQNMTAFLAKALIREIDRKIVDKAIKYNSVSEKLNALSPLNVLSRGYAVVEGERGVLMSAKELKKGDEIVIRFKDGEAAAVII